MKRHERNAFGNLLCRIQLVVLVLGGVMMVRPVTAAAQILVTVKGTVKMGFDDLGIFKAGRSLSGKDFTVTFAFNDAAAQKTMGGCAPGAASGYMGEAGATPAKAVLTIGGGSYVYGEKKDSEWKASRGILYDPCSLGSEIVFFVKEGAYPLNSLISFRLRGKDGGQQLTNTIDWHAPLSTTSLNDSPTLAGFTITRPNDSQHVTRGTLVPTSVTVGNGSGPSGAH